MSQVPSYSLIEDPLLSASNQGLQKEIDKDLKTLEDLNFESFLDEDILDDEAISNANDNSSDNSSDSVDEDNFFLENEEDGRKSSVIPPGEVLQTCFKSVLGLEIPRTLPPPLQKNPLFLDITEDTFSDDSSESLSLPVDEMFDEFLTNESESSNKATPNKKLHLSCPFVPMGCAYRSKIPRDISVHIGKMHKELMEPIKCCRAEFSTRMDYHNHIRSEHK